MARERLPINATSRVFIVLVLCGEVGTFDVKPSYLSDVGQVPTRG